MVAAPTEIDETLDMTISMSCDDPAVLGPRLGERWTTVTLDVTVASRYRIVVIPVENLGLELIRIMRCEEIDDYRFIVTRTDYPFCD